MQKNLKTMNLKQAIKNKVNGNKYPKLARVKLGRVLMVYASLPLFSAWAFLIAVPMCMTMSPTMWAKDKLRYFNEWRLLR